MSHDRMLTFIDSLYAGNSPFLEELEKKALEEDVPIIKKPTQSLLRFFMEKDQPENILEVGCAVGFSAILMCEYAGQNCRLTTIEKFEKRIPLAIENFKKSGMEKQITLLEGDATEILAGLDASYDFIFMDAAKAQYIRFLPDVLRLLKEGGILLSDNVLQEGEILESRYAVTRRNRTIHSRMREYLYEITHHELLETVILPIGDGVTVSVKKGNKNDKQQEKA